MWWSKDVIVVFHMFADSLLLLSVSYRQLFFPWMLKLHLIKGWFASECTKERRRGFLPFCLLFIPCPGSSSDSPIWTLTLRAALGNRKSQKCQLSFWLVFTVSTQEIWIQYAKDLGWDSSEFPRKQQIFVKCLCNPLLYNQGSPSPRPTSW